MRRWQYANDWLAFQTDSPDAILGELVRSSSGTVEESQVYAWREEIAVLRTLTLPNKYEDSARIYFEFAIPRLGGRVDVILICGPLIFLLEFKIGESSYAAASLLQAWDYALDLKNFHEGSADTKLVPILVASAAPSLPPQLPQWHADGVCSPIKTNAEGLEDSIRGLLRSLGHELPNVNAAVWEAGRYLPTPTIVEAARQLFKQHSVDAIARSDAGAANLARTSHAIDAIIEDAQSHQKKAICFVTGVPGAGKTLVGLDVASRNMDKDSASYSVYLSGNGPLVAVLQEALIRDEVLRSRCDGVRVSKSAARTKVKAFIQNVHHFRDEGIRDPHPPREHVVLFDEAQRAWTLEQTKHFMERKKGVANFGRSESDFLISCLDRHQDWAVVICLVGGGQEINTGEAGIREWLQAVLENYADWEVHVPSQLRNIDYQCEDLLTPISRLAGFKQNPNLHLATSMRSYRADAVSLFVQQLLRLDAEGAGSTLQGFRDRYPVRITRSLPKAKEWIRTQARGSERYGMIVSSQAQRLRPHAIDVRVNIDPVRWFLDDASDVRSSQFLEDAATEFQVQGLELDWACVVWDADLRYEGDGWAHHAFRGSRWNRIKKPERKRYLENAYRVLMTRARQGMVLVVPEGDKNDPTRNPEYYDPIFAYLRSIGLAELQSA